MMNPFVQRRILARLGLGATTLLFGLGIHLGFEAVVPHKPLVREFLYEPARYIPSPVVVRKPLPNVTVDTFDFVVQMPANQLGGGLKPSDFQPASQNDVAYRVMKTQYLSKEETHRASRSVPTIALLFDQSGSIAMTDPNNERVKGGIEFVNAMPTSARIGVYSFGEVTDNIPGGQPHTPFGSDANSVKNAIRALSGQQSGGTPTFTALNNVLEQLENDPVKTDQVILCFTDGDADDAYMSDQVIQRAQRMQVNIYFVALGGRGQTAYALNKQVADATQGELIPVNQATDLAGAFKRIANKVVRKKTSLYNLTLRATVTGRKFAQAETLRPQVAVRSGKIDPSIYEIRVQKGGQP